MVTASSQPEILFSVCVGSREFTPVWLQDMPGFSSDPLLQIQRHRGVCGSQPSMVWQRLDSGKKPGQQGSCVELSCWGLAGLIQCCSPVPCRVPPPAQECPSRGWSAGLGAGAAGADPETLGALEAHPMAVSVCPTVTTWKSQL